MYCERSQVQDLSLFTVVTNNNNLGKLLGERGSGSNKSRLSTKLKNSTFS